MVAEVENFINESKEVIIKSGCEVKDIKEEIQETDKQVEEVTNRLRFFL